MVAERYAHTQSYRAFLAAEAERAIEQARAAAEVAAMNADAVAAAQQRLLEAFDEADIELAHDILDSQQKQEPGPFRVGPSRSANSRSRPGMVDVSVLRPP